QAPAAVVGDVDLRTLLDEVVEVNLLGSPARSRVTVECAAPLPAVRGDPAKLKQVLLNLLLNAVTATERGGAIALVARADGGEVAVTVRDSGPGIAPAHLGRIFEEGFSTTPGGN